jgi:hypothetical protein
MLDQKGERNEEDEPGVRPNAARPVRLPLQAGFRRACPHVGIISSIQQKIKIRSLSVKNRFKGALADANRRLPY